MVDGLEKFLSGRVSNRKRCSILMRGCRWLSSGTTLKENPIIL